MKESRVMKELHKIREKMSKLSRKEFEKGLIKAREEYEKLVNLSK